MPHTAPPSASLGLRWRADELTLADGAAVASWQGLVGNRTLAQSTAANRPTLAHNAVNGRKAVRWPDAANTLWLSSTVSTITGGMTVVLVLRPGASIGTAQIQPFHSGREVHLENGGWKAYAGANFGPFGTAGSSWQVVTMNFNTTNSALYRNGALLGSGAVGSQAMGTTLNIGRHTSSGRYWRGDIAEILIYSGAQNATNRALIHSYVQDTYGIPVSDYVPFNEPPTLTVEQPTEGQLFTKAPIRFVVNAADDVSVSSVTISLGDGQTRNMTYSSDLARWVYDLTPTAATSSMVATVTATDGGGKTATATRAFAYRPTADALRIGGVLPRLRMNAADIGRAYLDGKVVYGAPPA